MTTTMSQFNQYPWLTPVRLLAIANQTGTYINGTLNNGVGATFTYATGALTLDSVTVAVGDRVLLANQTNGNENGIYVCTQAGATGVAAILTRASDMQCVEQLLTGQYVSIAAGTLYSGSFYTLVEPKPAIFGVSSLLFEEVSLRSAGLHAATAVGAGGSATVVISDSAITTSSIVVASIQASANAVNIQKVTPTAGTLTILCSGDPGANTMAYHATAGAQ